MKDSKSDIVRIRDDGTAGIAAAPGDCPPQTDPADRDPALYGGVTPFQVRFPWRPFQDTFVAYFGVPAFVLFFAGMTGWGLCHSGNIMQRWGSNLIMILLLLGAVAWGACFFFLRYYRKTERSIDVDPAARTFHACNFVMTRGWRILPKFHRELTFGLDDIRKIVYGWHTLEAFYIIIPEGRMLVAGKSAEFARLRSFLWVEAKEKFVPTQFKTLDGIFPTMEDF